MAWLETFNQGSFRQVPFECVALSENRAKSVAINEMPYSNKAFVNDMGNDTRRYQISAFFSGEDYETYRDAFIIALDMAGAGELVHPLYGTLMVQVLDYSVKHEPDVVDSCTIDFNFITAESVSDSKELFIPVAIPPVSEQAPAVMLETPAETLAVYQEQLAQMSDPTPVAIERSIPERIRAEIHRIREHLQVSNQQIHDLFDPPDWINGLINDTIGLVHDIPLDADPMANWRRIVNKIEGIGDIFAEEDISPLRFVGAVLPVAMQSQTVLELLKLDNIDQILTPIDLQTINNATRQAINNAIAVIRRLDPEPVVAVNVPKIILDIRGQVANLKKAAAQLQILTDEAINRKPPLINYTVKSTTTLRLLAHRLYGDHARADELLRLNRNLINPALVQAGTRVAVYAR